MTMNAFITGAYDTAVGVLPGSSCMALHAEAAMNFIREVARTGGQGLFRAVHIQRQADNHGFRLPLFQQFLNNVPVRLTVLRFQRGERAGGAGDALPYGDANAFGTKIKA